MRGKSHAGVRAVAIVVSRIIIAVGFYFFARVVWSALRLV